MHIFIISLVYPVLLRFGDWVLGDKVNSFLISNFATLSPCQNGLSFITFNNIDDLLETFWSLEEVSHNKILADEDHAAEIKLY